MSEQLKAGDKVWVPATITNIDGDSAAIKFSNIPGWAGWGHVPVRYLRPDVRVDALHELIAECQSVVDRLSPVPRERGGGEAYVPSENSERERGRAEAYASIKQKLLAALRAEKASHESD